MDLAATTAKCLLFLFNVLFLVTGLAVIVAASMVYRMLGEKSLFVGSVASYPAAIIIAIGCTIFIISLFGFCGVIKENRCYLFMFSTLLLVVFMLEFCAAIYGYMYTQEVEQAALSTMHKSMQKYLEDDIVNKSWNSLQTDHKCCGTQNMTEWVSITKGLPVSCCYDIPVGTKCTEDKAFKVGCYSVIVNELESISCQLSTVAIGISMAQLISVLVACLLARHVHRYYEAV